MSRKIGHWYFKTSKYDSKTKFCRNCTKTKFCRNYTACPMSHSCEGRASFSSPLASPSWLVPYTNFLQVDPRVSTHLGGLFFSLFNQSINVLSPRHWWEIEMHVLFLFHIILFSPLQDLSSSEHNTTAMFSLDANMKLS